METLLNCPYCGGKIVIVEGTKIGSCQDEACPICDVPIKLIAWNRRYVCPDRHGKPVYAGDRAKAADCEGKVDRLGGICIESEDGHLHHVWPSEIELIEKSEADNDSE